MGYMGESIGVIKGDLRLGLILPWRGYIEASRPPRSTSSIVLTKHEAVKNGNHTRKRWGSPLPLKRRTLHPKRPNP